MRPMIFYKDKAIRGAGVGLQTESFPGRDPAFDPRSLGNLALWLDATRHTAADGDAVTTWADLSGNGKHATQATAGKKPTYKTGILNGKPIVRFDGGDGLEIPAIDLTGTSGITIYAAATGLASGERMILEMSANQAAQTDSFYLNVNATSKLDAILKGDVGLSQFVSTATITTTPHQLTAVYDKSLATSETTGYVDGATAGTRPSNTNNTNAFGNRVLYLGSRASTSLFTNGDIAEIMLFGVAHDATTRGIVQAYLKAKWGTP